MAEKKREKWDKLDGEPERAYSQFWIYATMGPSRSIQRAYLEYCDKTGHKPGKYKNRPFEKLSKTYDWVERAKAYDQREREADIQTRDALREALIEAELRDYNKQLDRWQRMFRRTKTFRKEAETARDDGTTVVYLEANVNALQRLAILRNRISIQGRRALGLPERISESKTNMNVEGQSALHIFLPELDDDELE